MYLLSEFEKLNTGIDYKVSKKMQLDFVIRLIKKLMERNITDAGLARMLEDLLRMAVDYSEGREPGLRYYRKQKSVITNHVLKNHGLVYKGYYTALYMSLGLIFGSALGTILMATGNTALYATGVGPGLAIGVAIGAAKEKQADKEGKIY